MGTSKKDRKSFADILQGIGNDRRRKLESKLPSWAGSADRLVIPDQLCLEQCSSEATARYKAAVALLEIDGRGCPAGGSNAGGCPVGSSDAGGSQVRTMKIADLTGGFGVDSWFFAAAGADVLYFERKPELAEAAKRNFEILRGSMAADADGSSGTTSDGRITVTATEFGAGEESWTQLATFAPDLIYADPARRDAAGRKVFLLEDCSPDITAMLPRLWEVSSHIMLKLSPMADIAMLAGRLGAELKEVHVVGGGGECKELLCLLEKGHEGGYSVTVAETGAEEGSFTFLPEDERDCGCSFGSPELGMTLLEPKPAMLKSGCFNLPCGKWGLRKASHFSHLYFCDCDAGIDGALPFFKRFRIVDILPFSSSSIKECAKKWPAAEVSARGLKISSDELRLRLKVQNSDSIHIFGCVAGDGEKLLVVGERLHH